MCFFFVVCLKFKMSREQLVVQRARKSFQTGRTKPLEFRIHQLKSLLRFISERRSDIADAVKKDLGKVGQSFALKCCWRIRKLHVFLVETGGCSVHMTGINVPTFTALDYCQCAWATVVPVKLIGKTAIIPQIVIWLKIKSTFLLCCSVLLVSVFTCF